MDAGCPSIKGRQPTQITTDPNKNSLRKQFAQTRLPPFCLFYREKGDSLCKLFRNCLRKLCFYLGWVVFWGGSPLHESKFSDILFPYRSPSPRPQPVPTQHPEKGPKRTRNRPETEPKRSQTEPKWSQTEPKWTEIELFGVGRAGGLSG